MSISRHLRTLALLFVALAAAASGQQITFKDPTGDDHGPGKYKYPTDTVYKPGSFDLTQLSVKKSGDKVDFEVTLNSTLEDPWKMGQGFAVQMIMIFIDQDHKEGSGFTDGLPGLYVKFAPADAWDKAVILSPQGLSRVRSEVDSKAASMKDAVLVPERTKGSGRKIFGSVPLKNLGGDGDVTKWGYQVVVQSNEGFPDAKEVLTRRVNEYEGQHRFGGGNDLFCDPHVMDVLAGDAKGDKAEIESQHTMLKYECAEDGSAKSTATLTMVRGK
jgi:carbohydrate-binding DOMON domain-containing protein